MLLDGFFIGLLLALGALGAWRGAVASGSGLMSLLAGYAGSVLGAARASDWVERSLIVSPLVAPAIAGTLGFVAAWLVVSSLSGVVLAWDRSRVEEIGRGGLDRALGGLLGLARGGLILVLLTILVSWIDAGRDLGALAGWEALPDAQESAVVGASGALVEAAVAGALSETGPAADVAGRLVGRPGESLAKAQQLLDDERLNALFSDELFWTAVQNDSIDYALNRSSVRMIVLDPELRARFADLGFVGDEARDDPDLFRNRMAEVFAEVGPRIARLQHDPEMKSLAQDPQILALLESGNTLGLITHPRIQQLVRRLSSEPR